MMDLGSPDNGERKVIFDPDTSVEIDSLSIRVPVEFVEVHSVELRSSSGAVTTVNKETGEMVFIKNIKLNKTKAHSCECGNTTYHIKNVRHDSQTPIKCLTIGVSSKLLGKRYYDGLTENNIGFILDAIEQQGIISIPDRKSFLANTRVTDIDLKQDRILTPEEWKQEFELAISLTIPSPLRGKGYEKHGKHGIEWSERRSKQTKVTNPYLKLYSKEAELKENSKGFWEKHLKGISTNICRLEGTLKDNKDLIKCYGIDNTLLGLLRTPQSILRSTLGKMVQRQIDLDQVNNGPSQKEMDLKGVTLQQSLDLGQIEGHIKRGASFEEAIASYIHSATRFRPWTSEQIKQKKKNLRKLKRYIS